MRSGPAFTLRYGNVQEHMTHKQGASMCRLLSLAQRIPHRTRTGGRNVLPMAMLENLLNRSDDDDLPQGLVSRIGAERVVRLSRGDSTEATIMANDVPHDADLGVLRPGDASMSRAADGRDDPVLSRLLDGHGVADLCRTAPGMDAFWGGLEERQTWFGDANPYHRLTGLPESMPPFLVRPAWGSRSSCVAVSLAPEALYCQEGGHAWLGTTHRLPDTVLAHIPGRPATDLVGHEALEGWVVESPFDHHPDDAAHAPTAYNLRWTG